MVREGWRGSKQGFKPGKAINAPLGQIPSSLGTSVDQLSVRPDFDSQGLEGWKAGRQEISRGIEPATSTNLGKLNPASGSHTRSTVERAIGMDASQQQWEDITGVKLKSTMKRVQDGAIAKIRSRLRNGDLQPVTNVALPTSTVS